MAMYNRTTLAQNRSMCTLASRGAITHVHLHCFRYNVPVQNPFVLLSIAFFEKT